MRLTGPDGPLGALGMTSLVLGVIAMFFGVVPVLGLPISLFALLFGLVGLGAAALRLGPTFRSCMTGVGASLLAAGVNFAVAYMPAGYQGEPDAPHIWQQPPDRPSNPPPAPAIQPSPR